MLMRKRYERIQSQKGERDSVDNVYRKPMCDPEREVVCAEMMDHVKAWKRSKARAELGASSVGGQVDSLGAAICVRKLNDIRQGIIA